jgi:hypothetical protein
VLMTSARVMSLVPRKGGACGASEVCLRGCRCGIFLLRLGRALGLIALAPHGNTSQ